MNVFNGEIESLLNQWVQEDINSGGPGDDSNEVLTLELNETETGEN